MDNTLDKQELSKQGFGVGVVFSLDGLSSAGCLKNPCVVSK